MCPPPPAEIGNIDGTTQLSSGYKGYNPNIKWTFEVAYEPQRERERERERERKERLDGNPSVSAFLE